MYISAGLYLAREAKVICLWQFHIHSHACFCMLTVTHTPHAQIRIRLHSPGARYYIKYYDILTYIYKCVSTQTIHLFCIEM